ncbi:MAG: hypothetical protein KVP17_005322 [Porospora cf. gigantea B]|uniref:uncharacterized protein n=1 Tax=Porospora cf. gigantea B TaxID=2853592 RepID=UPI003571E93D|nr:MAG: hypothetical protein KVP17_005322 [Porospora cf. gigantea B]
MSESCAISLLRLNLTQRCFRVLVLSALNAGVILGAAVIQLPQLYSVWAAKSARGISEVSVVVGVISQSMYITYCLRQELSMTSWAESGLVGIQLVVLLSMMWLYSSKPSRLISGAMAWIALLTAMYRVPHRHLWLLGILPSQLGAAGRVPQLIVTWRLKSLGTLSVVPFIGAALGNLARIITTAAEVDDTIVLVGHAIAFGSNIAPVLQAGYYYAKSHRDNKED